jgi:hypothetical protein
MQVRTHVLACCLAAVSLTAWAGPQRDKQPVKAETARFGDPTSTARIYQTYLYGVIKQIDASEMVLEKTKFGIDQTFKLEPKTKYLHDGKPSARDRLKVGDQVWVDVKTDKKTGDLIAKKIVTGVAFTLAAE